MYRRKIYDKLVEWKNHSQGRTALLIEGARRVGKSTIVEEFGRREYQSFVMVDFMKPNKKVVAAIKNHPEDLTFFFNELTFAYKVELHERNTLIVFDEVQRCPQARELIKALVADGRYDYIETGSLVSIRLNVADITIPSEEEAIGMFPMDFEEFLWAAGDFVTYPRIRAAFENRAALGASAHETVLERFREYLMVGGMPQVVARYLERRDFREADLMKRMILKLYRDDVAKFAKSSAAKVRRIFDGIPGQLAKKEKKYSLSSLGKDARRRTYEDAFLWLDDAKVVNAAYNATDPNAALAMSADDATVKLYSSDTGLLLAQALGDAAYAESELYREVYSGDLGINEGMVMENYVAQAFAAKGRKLYFYSRYDLENAENRMEIDFLIRRGSKLSPVEVKSGKGYRRHASLDKFCVKFADRIGEAFVLCPKDVTVEDEITYLPLYMADFLTEAEVVRQDDELGD